MQNALKELPLRLEYLNPAELARHPLNPKFHPVEQLDTLDEFMGDVGWAGALLWNERTRTLLDGHGRLDLLLKKGAALAPVLVGNWTDEQERKILAFLDSSGWMAKVDKSLLTALSQAGELLASTDRQRDLLAAMAEAAELLNPAENSGAGISPSAGAGTMDPAPVPSPSRPGAAETPDAALADG